MGKIAAAGAVTVVFSLALTPAIAAVLGNRGAAPLARASSDIAPPNVIFTSKDVIQQAKVSLRMLGSIGSFTPVTRDPRLAQAYADAARESHSRSFRFTPASGSSNGERSLTVLVREGTDVGPAKHAAAPASGLGLAPVSYSLGKTKGLDRYAGDVSAATTRELNPITESVPLPGSNFALQAKPKRFSANIQLESRSATATEPTSKAPQTLGSEKTYAVDLSSSYSVTKNLDVQAGVRYRGPDNRMVPLTDQAQDSQAVYVGTKFKF